MTRAKPAFNMRFGRSGPQTSVPPEAAPTGLPSAPCFKCGARGWCDHRELDE